MTDEILKDFQGDKEAIISLFSNVTPAQLIEAIDRQEMTKQSFGILKQSLHSAFKQHPAISRKPLENVAQLAYLTNKELRNYPDITGPTMTPQLNNALRKFIPKK